jgi:hypothetical protein
VALAQCSVDRCIAQECVTASVLVSERGRETPIYSSRDGPYICEREREGEREFCSNVSHESARRAPWVSLGVLAHGMTIYGG